MKPSTFNTVRAHSGKREAVLLPAGARQTRLLEYHICNHKRTSWLVGRWGFLHSDRSAAAQCIGQKRRIPASNLTHAKALPYLLCMASAFGTRYTFSVLKIVSFLSAHPVLLQETFWLPLQLLSGQARSGLAAPEYECQGCARGAPPSSHSSRCLLLAHPMSM